MPACTLRLPRRLPSFVRLLGTAMLSLALAVLLVAGTTPSASAEKKTRSDPQGDHWGSDVFDVRNFTVDHGNDRVRFRVKMWNPPGGRHVAYRVAVSGPGGRWFRDVSMIVHTDGSTDGKVYRPVDGTQDPYDHEVVPGCRVTTRWVSRDRVGAFSIRRACLPAGRRAAFSLRAASIVWSQDPQDVVSAITVRRG